jgi:hypothetical protein
MVKASLRFLVPNFHEYKRTGAVGMVEFCS